MEGAAAPLKGEAESSWQDTIATVSPAIVNIRISRVRGIERSKPSFAFATGFVVDKARGIILSNRHVVGTGVYVEH